MDEEIKHAIEMLLLSSVEITEGMDEKQIQHVSRAKLKVQRLGRKIADKHEAESRYFELSQRIQEFKDMARQIEEDYPHLRERSNVNT
jgi:hypothetical protein